MKMNLKFKSIVVMMIGALLTGCVAVVVAGAAAGMVYDRRSVTTMEADARLFHVIHKAIIKDPRFSHSRILVTSFNRVVLLVGQTPAASLRVLAERIAQNAPGVKRVYDEITVDYPIPLTQRTKDSWITSQVRSNMLTKKGLESGSIRIVTENGVVYLMGIVSDEQALLAVDVARRVAGVRKVVKIFQYIR
ncbi:TPA: BON domain-containing protein [Legionella pneumophila]|jgi:osmotically-inducible protein OsmY|nr:BON domain-containing protein [Legionella pneumophila]MDW8878809.1 BON domain-containing protein [Legionella pneumophila subsp. fraseri]MDW8963357.1 BON domain-containing protein [Legionella pneumophila subsp. fraseri]MDW9035533.1 BON domain-containing protein [Legionella pneumophila subsp. fraseri]MDW9038594.1 BON domain-containing protein [Legionella pneumophila subsp. fraseri]MDW9041655.1 BON domain-containing protein [Legionella pneumophila subsp. fraseri]